MSRTARLLLALGVALVLVLGALVGWRLLGRESTVAPGSALADQCDDVPDGAERMSFTGVDGTTLGGALVGSEGADVGVVLRQGAGQTICQWLPWAGEIAAATGARVLLFDRRGRGASPGDGNLVIEPDDLVSAVQVLRREGTTRIALAASSMGNSVMFSALDHLDSPPCAVVSISPVLTSTDGHGTVDGTPMERLPDNVWVTWEGENPDIVSQAQLIQDRAQEQGIATPQLLEVDTRDHSIALVNQHAEVRDFLESAIGSCTAATP